MKSTPFISIIIPVFNEEKYLEFCLDSLKNQTYQNIEIIVVDDGSTDNSKNIAKLFQIKFFEQKHKGPAVARNLGANKAKGEIFAFLDADIRYDKNYIKNLVKPIIQKNEIGSFNKEEYVANPENIWSQCWSINSDLPIGKRAPSILPDKLPIFRAIRKQTFIESGGYDEKSGYGEDNTISQKLGKMAISAPGAIAYHYNPETLSEVFYSARWIGRGEFFQKNLLNLLRFCPLNSLRISCEKVIHGAPFPLITFKLVYDFGIFCGIFLSKGEQAK